jgi:hypothetical protein
MSGGGPTSINSRSTGCQNYMFILKRGSNNESHTVTLADFPLMNPYDIFTIYSLSGNTQGDLPVEFRGFVRNFLRAYIEAVSVRDMVLCECLKGDPTPPNLKVSKELVNSIKSNREGRIIHKPEWGVLYSEKLAKSRTVKYHLARVDEKSLFADFTLTDLIRRANRNDDNSEKEQKELNDMLFWWKAMRAILKNQIPKLFDQTEYDPTRFQDA